MMSFFKLFACLCNSDMSATSIFRLFSCISDIMCIISSMDLVISFKDDGLLSISDCMTVEGF